MSPASRDPDVDPPRPAADWGRVADGVFLAGLGAFFLLATTRGVPDGFWVEAVSFWPVLLVSWGIRIVFEKTRMQWGVLLGPAVVLSTLFWLAWGDRPDLPPPGEWRALSVDQPREVDRAKFLVHMGGAHVDLEARTLSATRLAEGRVASRENEKRLRVSEDEGEATVRLEGRRRGIMLIGLRHEIWELGVTDRVPLSVDVSGAALRTDLDLRRGHVIHSEVSGAFNSVTLRLPRPPHQVAIRLEGAFNAFDVIVPEGTPVRYEGPGAPIAWVNKGPAHDGLSDEEPGYRVILDGAFSFVDIDEGPAPEGGYPTPLPPPAEAHEAEPPPPEDPDGAAVPPAEEPVAPAELVS
jgi:hypothetical protein